MEKINQESILVSFCIPCYNAEQYLAQTLTAILSQNHKNLEVIIVDDHSQDKSLEIIKKLAKKDQRVNFEIAKHKGASSARNQAYLSSKGDFVVFFDADDWIPANFIETQLSILKSEEEIAIARWGRFLNNDLKNINVEPSQIQNDLTCEQWIRAYWQNNSNMTCPGRVMISKTLIEKSGLWDENLSLNDDFEFFTRIFLNSTLIRYNKNTIFHYRSGISSLSSLKGHLAYQSLFQSIIKSINIAKSKFNGKTALNECYANLLQNFIYEVYPFELKLIKESEKLIKDLGGSNFKFPAGGKTKLFNYFFGWKLVKKIKLKISNL